MTSARKTPYWYWRLGNDVHGPLPEPQLIEMARRGELPPRCEVRMGSQGRWYPAAKVKGLFSDPVPDSGKASTAERDLSQRTAASPTSQKSGAFKESEGSASNHPKANASAPVPGGLAPANPAPAPPVPARPVPARPVPAVAPDQRPSGKRLAVAKPLPPPLPEREEIPTFIVEPDSRGPSPLAQKRKKKSNATRLVAALGVVVVLATLVLVIVMNTDLGGSRPMGKQATAGSTAPAKPVSLESLETDPVPASGPIGTSTPARASSAPSPLPPVQNWLDARSARWRMQQTQVRVLRVWVQPAKSDDAALPAGVAPDDEWICIELQIANFSPGTDNRYVSWNGGGQTARARLFDAHDTECPAVEPTEAALANRLDSATIGPGKQVRDVLVFRRRSGELQELRLVMPVTAIGAKRGDAMGYKIPTGMVGKAHSQATDDIAANDIGNDVATDDVMAGNHPGLQNKPSDAAVDSARQRGKSGGGNAMNGDQPDDLRTLQRTIGGGEESPPRKPRSDTPQPRDEPR